MPGITLRAAALEHHDAVLVDVEILVVDARVQVFDALEHHRAALVLQQVRRRRRRLDDRAIGREIAAQHRDAGAGLERLRERLDDFAVPARRVGDVLAERLAVDRERLAVEHVLDLAHHRRQAARVVEIFHEELARGLQVHEARQLRADLVPVLELERHADAPGDGQQVDDRVGRAADGGVHADRILERGARENFRQRHFLLDHLDDAPPGELRLPVAARIDGGNRRVAGQRDAERFDHARHGRRRAHGHAVTLSSDACRIRRR